MRNIVDSYQLDSPSRMSMAHDNLQNIAKVRSKSTEKEIIGQKKIKKTIIMME